MSDRIARFINRRRALQGLAVTGLLTASSPILADSKPDYPRLRRGIGVHNLLNWPIYTDTGGQITYKWPAFDDNSYRIDSAHLRLLSQAGFDFIRLTVDPSILIASDTSRRTQLHAHDLAVVHQLLEAGFNVIFDLHPVSLNPAYRPDALVASQSNPAILAYGDMVNRVATLLRDLPPDRLVLELFNEPSLGSLHDAPRWQTIAENLHNSARQAAPKLPLMLGGIQWNSTQGLVALDPNPFRSSNVLYTFHYYEPHPFTHQGYADWTYLSNVHWPTSTANLDAVEAASNAMIDANPKLAPAVKASEKVRSARLLAPFRAKPVGPEQIVQDFASVGQWAKTHGISMDRIVVGEFGCVGNTLGRPIGEDRLRWLRTVRTNAENFGFGWSFWAYLSYGGFARFQLLRDDMSTIDRETGLALGLNVGA